MLKRHNQIRNQSSKFQRQTKGLNKSLHKAVCVYTLTNRVTVGNIQFSWEIHIETLHIPNKQEYTTACGMNPLKSFIIIKDLTSAFCVPLLKKLQYRKPAIPLYSFIAFQPNSAEDVHLTSFTGLILYVTLRIERVIYFVFSYIPVGCLHRGTSSFWSISEEIMTATQVACYMLYIW